MNDPYSIQLYPTLLCNQDCSFCFNRGISDASSYKDMNVRDAHTLGNLLMEAGVHEIDILGGEPMLITWMKDFMKRMTESGITVNISTNGSLPEVVSRISELSPDLINIGFSLHGFSETHNALTQADNFSKAVLGIKKMVEKGKNPIVKSTLTRQNMHEIYDLVSYLKDLGVKRYFLLHEDIIGRQKIMPCFSFPGFREFYIKLKDNFAGTLDIGSVAASGFYKYGLKSPGRCDAGLQKIAIMPDGSIFPCNLFAGFKEFRLGNIFQDGIEKIWTSPILEQFRTSHDNTCKRDDCSHYANCSGGCPAHSYFFHGRIDLPDPRCTDKKT